MKYYIELWNAKLSWKSLSTIERGNYMNALGPAIEQLMGQGVEIITWSSNDPGIKERAPYSYFAIWRFPDERSRDSFEEMVEAAGWYQYFEQINLSGNVSTPQDIIGTLINL